MTTSYHSHNFVENDPHISKNETRTFWVVCLTALMMVAEIIAGYLTGSMALLADGWHMASHTAALGISVITYRLAKSRRLQDLFTFGAGKIIPLGGYTSAIILALMALLMASESIKRLLNPETILFDEAIIVAVIGLVVNLISAFILKDNHSHGHSHHHDHNLKSAYLHVLADALTSVLAIFALLTGKFYGQGWMDPIIGVLGAIVILKWSYGLLKETSWELLDGHAKAYDRNEIIKNLESRGCKIHDLHIWRIAPSAYACELVVSSESIQGSKFYREILTTEFGLHHITIEEIAF